MCLGLNCIHLLIQWLTNLNFIIKDIWTKKKLTFAFDWLFLSWIAQFALLSEKEKNTFKYRMVNVWMSYDKHQCIFQSEIKIISFIVYLIPQENNYIILFMNIVFFFVRSFDLAKQSSKLIKWKWSHLDYKNEVLFLFH